MPLRRLLALIAVLAVAPIVRADDVVGGPSPPVITAVGTWTHSTAAAPNPPLSWRADVMAVDGSELRGRVTITGAPGITAANLEGRLSGKGVSGTLLNDDGQTLAYFEGAVTAAGASGTYRHRLGQGTWVWSGEATP